MGVLWLLLFASAELTCPSATSLDELATCIRTQMPANGSNGYVAPTAAEQAEWRMVVRRMMDGACGFELPPGLAGPMRIRTFTDDGKDYCVLMEVLDANGDGKVDRGWGTFVVDAAAVREISHQAPHPIADSATENQAIGVFKRTGSRSFLMAGAHRFANPAGTCQPEYGAADPAHNIDNMFHATNAELMAWYGASAWWAIQWHGMAADTCPAADVYLSHGRNVAPLATDKIAQLRDCIVTEHPSWKAFTPGTGACTLNATDNTQGRMLNGVDGDVCTTAAASYSGRFIHIEQDPAFRNATDWSRVVNSAFPPKRRRATRSRE